MVKCVFYCQRSQHLNFTTFLGADQFQDQPSGVFLWFPPAWLPVLFTDLNDMFDARINRDGGGQDAAEDFFICFEKRTKEHGYRPNRPLPGTLLS